MLPRRHPLPEVQLLTHCIEEYTVHSVVRSSMGEATYGDSPGVGEREVVVVCIYVPRCFPEPQSGPAS